MRLQRRRKRTVGADYDSMNRDQLIEAYKASNMPGEGLVNSWKTETIRAKLKG